MRRILLGKSMAFGLLVATWVHAEGPQVPGPQEMVKSREDVWGAAALRQPGGPSYEFFKDLLPPVRYANTAFRHYPIVLGTPGGAIKIRYISNGSGINLRADKKPMWKEGGFPLTFHVGDKGELFGEDVDRLTGPRYRDGSIPILRLVYRQDRAECVQEAFAPVQGILAEHGAALVRFSASPSPTRVVARVADGIKADENTVRNSDGKIIVYFDNHWTWNGDRKELAARLAKGPGAVLAVLTKPCDAPRTVVSDASFEFERGLCDRLWKEILLRGVRLEVPEPIVQDAWRSLVIGNYLMLVGDGMNYSAGNAYDHLYESECGDATRAMLLFGQNADARRMVGPLLDFYRKATRYHVAGHKLQLLDQYYWVTRDADYVREREPVWEPVVRFIRESREKDTGLLPRDNYAGDIPMQVYSLNSNANCWRGLRDLAAVLDDMGQHERARELFKEAADYRAAILAAVSKSERRDVTPPFIPNALFGVEQPYEVLTSTKLGSYYDLMAPYTIGSGVFAPGSDRETWMIEYLQKHGGIAMGMIRSMPHQGEFNQQPGVNVLYGLRYMLALLRRDDRDRALVGFYGHLAQAMTRDTFIGGEGSRFLHGDKHGRSFYLPPNSASNAMFLLTLRYLLVQDWDLDDDGKPDTLRLLYGAPGRWLEDGKTIRFERAPTMFGPVSVVAESRLKDGKVDVHVTPPPHRPAKVLVRPALPEGWRVAGASVQGAPVPVTREGAVDVSERHTPFTVTFAVAQTR